MKKTYIMILLAYTLAWSVSIQANEASDLLNSPEVTIQEESIPTLQETVNKEELILFLNNKEALLNGSTCLLPEAPTVMNGSTYLPLRFVVETILHAEVDWKRESQKINIYNQEVMVSLTIGEKNAYVNEELYSLDQGVVIKKGVTLVPIRFLGEAFGLEVDYDNVKKTISITKTIIEENHEPQIGSNTPPVASISLNQDTYIEGQEILVSQSSYDADGDQITNYVWQLNGKTSSSADSLVKGLKEGTYELGLRVMDEKGAWSELVTQILVVKPNQPPQITSFNAAKQSYAIGEPLSFSYTYQNEEWESIQSERWLYRKMGEAANQAVITKPYAFFAEGDYIVSLQLTDSYGKVSQATETTVHITSQVQQSEWSYHFTSGTIGSIIDNFQGSDYRKYQSAPIQTTKKNQDILWMSDSPEVVEQNGILYQGAFSGEGRVLFHHINGFKEEVANKRFVLVAENTTSSPITLVLRNEMVKGPATDVLYIGQRLLYDYWQSTSQRTITIKPSEQYILYDSGSKNWQNGQCLSGLMDLEASGEVKLTTAVIEKDLGLEQLETLPILGRSIHIRGSFEGTIIEHTIALNTNEPTQVVLGQYPEEWVAGTDLLTGDFMQNKGNFGVSYRLTITAKEDMGVILNPRANVFRGAIKWVDTGTYLAPNSGYFIGQNKKAVLLGVIKKGETRVLEYMLPNGSSAPVLIGFIPKSEW